MLNSALEFHDSNIHAIRQQGNDVAVLFSEAYIHKSRGRPGLDKGSGWVQAAQLTIMNSSAPSEFPADFSEWLSTARLQVDDQVFNNMVPIPFTATGETELEIVFGSGETVMIRGSGVALIQLGEARYVEEFSW